MPTFIPLSRLLLHLHSSLPPSAYFFRIRWPFTLTLFLSHPYLSGTRPAAMFFHTVSPPSIASLVHLVQVKHRIFTLLTCSACVGNTAPTISLINHCEGLPPLNFCEILKIHRLKQVAFGDFSGLFRVASSSLSSKVCTSIYNLE